MSKELMENVGTIFNIVLSSANISSACPRQKSINFIKVYKQKFTFCTEESEQKHERATCYCSAQLIKRVKK